MSVRNRAITLVLLGVFLVIGCGSIEPTATSIPPTDTLLPPTATPVPPTLSPTQTPTLPTPMPTPLLPTQTASPAPTPTATDTPTPAPTAIEAFIPFDFGPGFRAEAWTYGGPYNDRAFDVLALEDGGLLIAGLANNTAQAHGIVPGNAQVIRIDARDSILWEKEYGGEKDASFSSIIQAGEDEYLLLGEIAASYVRGETDLYLVRIDGQGDEIWSRTFGGRGMNYGKMVRQTADGGYILIGSQSDENPTGFFYEGKIYLIKTDAEGNELWSKTYKDQILYLGWAVAQTADGGYVLAGWEARTYSDRDAILIKTDGVGKIEWSRTWDLEPEERDGAFDLILTADGYVVMACIQAMGSGRPSAVLIKVDLEGNEIWNKLIGEKGVGNTLWHIMEDADRGYVLAGDTHLGWVPGTGQEGHGAWLVKTDRDGEILWQQIFGEGKYAQAHFHAGALLPAGGYVLAGDVTPRGERDSDMVWLRIGTASALDDGGGRAEVHAAENLQDLECLYDLSGYAAAFHPRESVVDDGGGRPGIQNRGVCSQLSVARNIGS